LIVFDYSSLIAKGAVYTIIIFVGASTLAILIGTMVGVLLARPKSKLQLPLRIYVEVFRGTSAVVQLFWIFYVLPIFGVRLPAVGAAIIGLGLCFGAYTAEAIRSGVLQIPKGQFEAALALGLRRGLAFRLIVLPQLLKLVLPLLENIMILLLKATAGASLITVPELTFTGYVINSATYQTFAIFTMLLVIYYVIATAITFCAGRLRRRYDQWASI
jgi:polar amino acid transport system permease protein